MPLDPDELYLELRDKILSLRARYKDEKGSDAVGQREKQITFLENHLAILEKMMSQRATWAMENKHKVLLSIYGKVIAELKTSYEGGFFSKDPWDCTLYTLLVKDLVGNDGSNLRKEARLAGLGLKTYAECLTNFTKLFEPIYEVFFKEAIPNVLHQLRERALSPRREEESTSPSLL